MNDTPQGRDTRRMVLAATVASAAMIGQQVGAKAARDAFFLSQFDISVLPTMIAVSALVSIVAVRGVMARPAAWLLPRGFAASGVLLLGQWWLADTQPRIVAVALYLHVAVFGSVLISAFWGLVTERLDPYTARRRMGQIATGASVGAVLGGFAAERVGALLTVTALFPVLAGLHLACAALVLPLRPAATASAVPEAEVEAAGVRAGLRVFARLPYLRNLGYLVLVGAVSAALIDFAFKAEVAGVLDRGEAMMRFFAVYYTAVGMATLVVQGVAGRWFLERLGLAPTVATLPGGVLVGSLGMLLMPGLAVASIARGAEGVLRSSLFRSGYELFYSPVSPRDKRATKTVVDVLGERLGDVVGGTGAKLLLLLGPIAARPAILTLAAALGGLGLLICRKLHGGYVEALEASLRGREHVVRSMVGPGGPGSVPEAPGALGLESVVFTIDGGLGASIVGVPTAAERSVPAPGSEAPTGAASLRGSPALDGLSERFARLRSADPQRVREALVEGPLEPELVPQAIRLLARDEVASEAVRVLAALGGGICGQLGDALLDPKTEFAVRRRVVRVLAGSRSARAVPLLVAGLRDRTFVVRSRCGRGLVRLQGEGVSLSLAEGEVYAFVLAELDTDRSVWERESRAEPDEGDEGNFDQPPRRRAHTRLEHVFTLLSLILPRGPLKIAFRGLHTDDAHLRGTALEYLGSVLPEEIRARLWPHVTGTLAERISAASSRSRQEIVADLMRSSDSILSRLDPGPPRKD